MRQIQFMDLAAVIGSYFPLRAGAVRCPFHDSPAELSFTVDVQNQTWRCSECGAYGDVVDFVSRYDNVSKTVARRRLQAASKPAAQPQTSNRSGEVR